MSYPAPIEGFSQLTAEASAEQIEQLLGMGYDLFTNTILFVQVTAKGTAKNFIDCDDGEQKDRFRRLFSLQAYEDAGILVAPDLKKINQELSNFQAQLALDTNSLAGKQSLVESLQAALAQFNSAKDSKVAGIKSQIADLEAAYQKADKAALEKTLAEARATKEEISKIYRGYANELALLQADRAGVIATMNAIRKEETTTRTLLAGLQMPKEVPLLEEKPELVTEKAGLTEELEFLGASKLEMEQAAKEYDAIKARLAASLEAATAAVRRTEEANRKAQIRKDRLIAQREDTNCPTCKQSLPPEQKATVLASIDAELATISFEDTTGLYETLEMAKRAEMYHLDTPFDKETYEQVLEGIGGRKVRILAIDSELRKISDSKVNRAVYEGAVASFEKYKLEYNTKIVAYGDDLAGQLIKDAEIAKAITAKEDVVHQYEAGVAEANLQVVAAEHQLSVGITTIQTQLDKLTKEQQIEILAKFSQQAELDRASAGVAELADKIEKSEETKTALGRRQTLKQNLADAFGNEGIVAELFKEYTPAIQERANDYLTHLTNGELEIEFRPEKELKKKVEGVNATRAQFNIMVRKKTGADGYDLISGSDQRKAALICNWAITDLAYEYSNIHSNIRVFDEIFDSLDAKGVERLAAMLLKFKGILLVITHKVELDDSFSNKIVLRKEKGRTQLIA